MMLTDALPICLLSLNSAMHITEANSFAESLFGLTPEDMEGTPLSHVIRTNDMIFDLLRDALEHGIVMKAYDHEVHLADGRNLRAHLYVSPRWDMSHTHATMQPVGAYLAIDSLLGADRIDRQVMQREIAKRAGLMAAMLAHEVKNPLSGIRGAAQLIHAEMQDEQDEEQRRLTGLIMREVDRISATLDKVEFLTHSSQPPREAVNIHEILHYVRAVLDPALSRKVTFRELYDPSIPEVLGNRDLLIQLFLNLAKNALEAVQETDGAVIALSTYFRHDFRLRMKGQTPLPIIVSIMDSGPGIPPAMHETIFDPYVTTKKGGNGLGLAICAKIAAEHGGLIELAESRPGNTVFSVMLPAARS